MIGAVTSSTAGSRATTDKWFDKGLKYKQTKKRFGFQAEHVSLAKRRG